jgi:hypothetical protein
MDEATGKPAADAEGGSNPPARLSPLMRRAVALAVIVVACALAWGITLAQFDLSKGPKEVEFGASPSDARVSLYVQPIKIDPLNDSLEVRISVVPDPSLAEAAATIADRDFLLKVRRGKQVEHVPIRAKQPLPEVTFEFDLDGGDVRDYPLDRYVSVMTFSASERGQDGTEMSLPIRVTAWEGLLGFDVEGQTAPTQRLGELQIKFAIRRTGAVSFFGLAIYGAMIVMAICALTIGSLVFVGMRRIEVGLAGTLGAMIFALPALRNALPGAPPFGVRGDLLIFFWAELAAIIALSLIVGAWAHRGAPH